MRRMGWLERCLFILACIVAALAIMLVCLRQSHGGPLRSRIKAWRPTLTASIDKTTCRVGETVTVTYRAGDGATACRANVSRWAMFVGRSDGILLPTEGQYTVTPTEVGEIVTNITAYKRLFDFNHSGGDDPHAGPDGKRRTVTKFFTIMVVP